MQLSHKLILLATCVFLTVLDASAYFVCPLRYNNHIRSQADFKASITHKVLKYTPLKVIDRKNDWLKVQSRNVSGWIHSKIVDDNIKCISPLNLKDLDCPGKKFRTRLPVKKGEAFKVIKNEVGCALVADMYGNKFYIFSANVWPLDNVNALEI